MKYLLIAVSALALTGCASMDAAHIEGQRQDANKYRDYTDVEIEKQVGVQKCFEKATDASSTAMCAMYGMATGMASTFGGRPTGTIIAPTTAQAVGKTVEKVAPLAAAAKIADSVSSVQSKDPVVVEQETLVVRPEVVNPVIVRP